MTSTTNDDQRPVAVVTQTRVLPDGDAAFQQWLDRLEAVARTFPGYVDQSSIEPAPPLQPEWVVVQRFGAVADAQAWLESELRLRLLEEVQPCLVGQVDVHLFTEGTQQTAAASAVIATRVAPDKEEAFLAWHRRIAAAQAHFPGYRGYRLERPIPGVQEDWVAILRFDSEAHLDAWLDSRERHHLLHEGGALAQDVRVSTVRSGFDAWFTFDEATAPGAAAAAAPAWKQNMLVLLALYPVVFLFGEWVHTPLLIDNDVPFWLALFIGNVVSVALLGWVLVPWVSRRFRWWLTPGPAGQAGGMTRATRDWIGVAVVVSLYALSLAIFSRF